MYSDVLFKWLRKMFILGPMRILIFLKTSNNQTKIEKYVLKIIKSLDGIHLVTTIAVFYHAKDNHYVINEVNGCLRFK